ncbi:MAG: SMP-30/gluconolactonase/LRE family protein [Bacteroidota bacterium]
MIKKFLNVHTILFTFILVLSICACNSPEADTEKNFIKGVYGDPGTLLDAGYNFDELGMNAIFVRSYSLDDELYNAAREQGCRVFVEFPVLLGRQFLEDNPQCWPVENTGEPSPPADWFMGICPTCPDFKEDRRQYLISILKRFEVDGVFLDYLHWHAQFETPEPILPETCFCDRCTGLFSKEYNIDIPGENIPGISEHILSFYETEWREWRSSILTEWITDLKQILKSHQVYNPVDRKANLLEVNSDGRSLSAYKIMSNRFNFFIAFSLLLFISCNNRTNTDSSGSTDIDTVREQLKIEVYDSSALAFVDPDATFEILAKGFYWSEGPLWIDELESVIFSDVPANKIYKWNEKDSLSIYLESAGHSGKGNKDSDRGPNGLILNTENKLLICQHGDRRIARLNADLKNPQEQFVTIADTYKGKKFNSPNDLTIDRAGNIYFTDPPYGLPENKTGEIGINGVYKVSSTKDVTLLVDSLTMPNGLALSPDQKTLYINQSDPDNPVLYSYEIAVDGSLENGKILFDFLTLAKTANGLPDGLKVHKSGKIFTTGPGGVHIISPEGKHLALIKTGKATANCAFDTGQKYLYMTTTDLLMRVRLK